MFHITLQHDWFNSFASNDMLSLVHLQDGTMYAVTHNEERSESNGALLVLL